MKLFTYIASLVGIVVGGFIPTLYMHGDRMIFACIVGAAVGGLFGVYVSYKLLQYFDY
ncbi:hypothetical protein KBB76_01760 [Candidatus Saccharibacteria bacterium]|nr:hypothetical protein [Candidatus Saccharibacteria bacterium]